MLVPELSELHNHQFNKNYLKKRFPEFVHFVECNYPDDLLWKEKLYWWKNDIKTYPLCPECGSRLKYYDYAKGYQKYCSKKCANNSHLKKEKCVQTCLERYGCDNPRKSPIVKEKAKQTCIEKYGVESPAQCQKIKDKMRQTCVDRYGESYGKLYIHKMGQTCLEKYGVEYITQSDVIKDKIKQTCLEKYGVEYSFAADEVKEKIKQTNLEKYGVDNPNKSEEIRKKIKQTCIDRYGVDCNMKLDLFKEQSKQTCLEKYGVEYITQSDVIKDKIKQTNLERYGVKVPIQNESIKKKILNSKRKNHTFSTSKIEQSFKRWLDNNHINYEHQYRGDKYPFMCDFYFPDKDLYLEIQGSWVHGFHPYNSNNEDDRNTLNKWKEKNTKFYNTAINVWTERDPLKRETAKRNGLNWVEVFTNKLDVLIEKVKPLII